MRALIFMIFMFALSTMAFGKCDSATIDSNLDGYAEVDTSDKSMGTICFQLYANRMDGISAWIHAKLVRESWKLSNMHRSKNLFAILDLPKTDGPSLLVYIVKFTDNQLNPRLMMLVSTSEEADCDTNRCGPFRYWFSGMSRGEVFHDEEFSIDDDGSHKLSIVLNSDQINTLLSLTLADKAYIDIGEGEIRLSKSMQDSINETIHVFQNHLGQLVEK